MEPQLHLQGNLVQDPAQQVVGQPLEGFRRDVFEHIDHHRFEGVLPGLHLFEQFGPALSGYGPLTCGAR